MRINFSPFTCQWLPKTLPVCLLAVLSMPAHSTWIDTPNVRDGLQFGIFATVNPKITHTSNKFHYTLGDPKIYGDTGTMAQVLADQDRQDADRRLRADGVEDGFLQLATRQTLTKDLTLVGSVAVFYNEEGHYNYGSLWGATLLVDGKGSMTVGDGWTRLPVRQTDANNIIQNRGTNIAVEYTQIPDLTLSAYHMFTASSDVNDPQVSGWHKSHGASAKYVFDLAPRNKLTVALGATQSKGHDSPFYVNTPKTGKSFMGSAGYQYKDLNIAVDYGRADNQYNGHWAETIKSTVFGVKATYDFTPRLQGTLSYAHKADDNTKPIDLQFLINNRFGVNNSSGFPTFDKSVQNRYKAGLDYQLYKGVTLSASVEDERTRNYISEGEFSRRQRLHTAVGASLSF